MCIVSNTQNYSNYLICFLNISIRCWLLVLTYFDTYLLFRGKIYGSDVMIELRNSIALFFVGLMLVTITVID